MTSWASSSTTDGWSTEPTASLPPLPSSSPTNNRLELSQNSNSSMTSSLSSMIDTTATSFDLLKTLGRGAFATCWLAKRLLDNKYVAVKHFHTPLEELDAKLEQSVHAEVESLKLLSTHRNVTTYHGFFLEPSSFSLVMEFCESGTLSSLIDEHHEINVHIPEDRIWEIVVQCLDALHHVHQLKIIHRDLKPENILLQGKDKRLVKLCDFGVSSLSQTMASTTIGTPYYLSPELCEGEMYGTAADMWSFGCCVYELCALERPFHGESLGALVRNIMKNEPKKLSNTHYSSDVLEIVSAFLVLESHLRATAETILAWPQVNNQFKRFNVDKENLIEMAEKEAQETAANWDMQHQIDLQQKEDCNGETKNNNNTNTTLFNTTTSTTSTTSNTSNTSNNNSRQNNHLNTNTNRALISKSRVWRFGSGQSTPKLVESLLESGKYSKRRCEQM